MVAALYVEKDGVYYGLPDVDPWDEARDARLYAGPWPVVAHPPCRAWSVMSNCRPEIVAGDDGGCFWSALRAVGTYGGVLEHPAKSGAWRAFGLTRPMSEGWTQDMWAASPTWTCEVDQRHYGHEANKPTWLYFVGADPPDLEWGRAPAGDKTVGRSYGQGRSHLRSRTPIAFRDLLLDMARSASVHRTPSATSIGGVPIKTDESAEPGRIELRDGETTVAKIKNISSAATLDDEQRTVLEVYSRTHAGLVPDAIQAILASHDGLLGRVESERAVIEEWLTDVDDAGDDQPGAHDFYVRVGARWSKGRYYDRMKAAVSSSRGAV